MLTVIQCVKRSEGRVGDRREIGVNDVGDAVNECQLL